MPATRRRAVLNRLTDLVDRWVPGVFAPGRVATPVPWRNSCIRPATRHERVDESVHQRECGILGFHFKPTSVEIAFRPDSGSGCRGRGRQSTPNRQPRGARSSHATRAQRGVVHHESARALSGAARQRRLVGGAANPVVPKDRNGAEEPPMKFIHAADIYLDSFAPEPALASLTSLYHAVESRKPVAVLLAGDLFARAIPATHHTSGRHDRPDSHRPRDHRLHADLSQFRGHRRTAGPASTRRWSHTSRS